MHVGILSHGIHVVYMPLDKVFNIQYPVPQIGLGLLKKVGPLWTYLEECNCICNI